MTLPGFTAVDSLATVTARRTRAGTSVNRRENGAVIAQSKADAGLGQAEHIRDVVGFGQVRCEWFEYCEGHMPNIHCGIRKVCYWWPW